MEPQQQQKYVSIGIDDFKEFSEGNYYFADKSLLIKELLDSRAKVTLIPRPRRFGKTLNLSMVRYFFEKTEKSNRHLFNGLKIELHEDCMYYQGQYPVIWLTFKDVKTGTWQPCYEKLCKVIGEEFKRHLDSITPVLSVLELQHVESIIAGIASQVMYESALLDLSIYLERAHQSKVMLFIDEYDAPVHAGYLNGYYNEVVGFMRGLLGAGLKGNPALKFGFLTGILRVAQPSLARVMTSKHELSYGGQASPPINSLGLNDLEVNTLLSKSYSDKFGFLEDEVISMLAYYRLEHKLDEVRQWYDGYQSGPIKVYNPWSIINLVKNQGFIQAYWVNTSDNALIKDLLRRSTPSTKEELEVIVNGGSVTKQVDENIIMPDIDKNDEVLWSFLLFCGYLTFRDFRRDEHTWVAELSLPNDEVLVVYKNSFKNWFLESSGTQEYVKMLEGLIAGDVDLFQELFTKLTRETLSSFDIRGDEPERFYHALVLGILASLSKTHIIRSNRESGFGRYDVMIIPKDLSKLGIIIEFKRVRRQRNETLEAAAHNALEQINTKQYETELRAMGVTNSIKLGIAFQGKESLVLVG